MAKAQKSLFEYFDGKATHKRYGRTQYGGASTKGHRKLERPLSTRKWIHLVLKSEKAKGRLSFLSSSNKIFIEDLLRKKALKFGIRIADYANVGNHLHLKVRISSRENFQKFLRSVTSLVARKLTGARRGKPFGRFWQGLAFTRVLLSSLEELNLRGYIDANRIEATVSKAAREKYLRKFNAWVYRERNQAENFSSA